MAVDTFDVSRGTMFSTWALEQVRKYIGIGLTDESRTVRQSAHMVKAKEDYYTASMDAPLGNEDGDEKTLLDTFASASRADNLTDVADMKLKIEYLMRGLDEREKAIVCGLFADQQQQGEGQGRPSFGDCRFSSPRPRHLSAQAHPCRRACGHL